MKLTPFSPSESALQGQILQYLSHEQARGRVAWYCRNNGGGARFKGVWVWFYWLYLYGLKVQHKGRADIDGMLKGGRYFALEVKKPGESGTEDQMLFADAVRAGGGIAHVVRSWEDVRSVLWNEIDPYRDQTPWVDRG